MHARYGKGLCAVSFSKQHDRNAIIRPRCPGILIATRLAVSVWRKPAPTGTVPTRNNAERSKSCAKTARLAPKLERKASRGEGEAALGGTTPAARHSNHRPVNDGADVSKASFKPQRPPRGDIQSATAWASPIGTATRITIERTE